MKSLNDIVKSNLCLGCGLCNLNFGDSDDKIKLEYSNLKGHFIPQDINSDSTNAKLGYDLCPGKGYKIKSLATEYEMGDTYNEDIGYYRELKVVSLNNKEILEKSSSSGIMTLLVKYMLDTKLVDKAIVTKFEYKKDGPKAISFSTNNFDEIIESQGSKYCPVDLSQLIEDLKNVHGKYSYVFVGLPCQIASLKYIQNNIMDLGIKYFIGSFCGGYKSYNNLNQLIKLNNFQPGNVDFFRFRGGGQPGSLLIQSENKEAKIPYPEYVQRTGYLKLKRCHLCVDATAELADFACGDAWLPEYQNRENPTSIVITRTNQASAVLNKMFEENLINWENISPENVIKSQLGNIKSKKYRQKSRMRLYGLLGKKLPSIEEGFKDEEKYVLGLELNIFVRHQIKLFFERVGLYYLLYYKKTRLQRFVLRLFR